MRCTCCYCKAQRKEAREMKEKANPKCLDKNCSGHYARTDRTDRKGLRIFECNVCKEEAV